MDNAQTPARWHVLLVGIDAYARVRPLNACVNDIDAIEAILLDRVGVPAEAVTKLVAPHPSHQRRPRLPEQAPTYANLRAALDALGTESVQPGDRVLIYYAGHGTQVLPSGLRSVREALVPMDLRAGGALLYDCEINRMLGRLASRTSDLTVVLDCCCSAGTTRDIEDASESAVRFVSTDADAVAPPPELPASAAVEPAMGLLSSVDPADPGYIVVAACQANEAAHEALGDQGRAHGALTAALLRLLAAESDSGLHTLRWADIWQALRERVTGRYPGQHPWLVGRSERRLFGGPFRPHDAGYPVRATGDRFHIAAGTMVGLTRGARVAVYGPAPDFFPPLGSKEDIAARLGVLTVQIATPAFCTAVPAGDPFALVQGARGRYIAAGEQDALVVQLDPYDAALARWLEANGPLRLVPPDRPADSIGTDIPEAFVGQNADGSRWIHDSVFRRDAAAYAAEPPLAHVPAGDTEALLRGLYHFAKRTLVLRLAQRCRDLPNALAVRVLDCRDTTALAAAPLEDPSLPEVPADPQHRSRYMAEHGQPICMAVENRSTVRLYVNVFNCAVSGRVEMLGTSQVEIPAGRQQIFWMGGQFGRPFRCGVPAGRSFAVDQLIAVGSTRPDIDLSFLQEPRSFQEAITAMWRDIMGDAYEPREIWTATLTTLKIAHAHAM